MNKNTVTVSILIVLAIVLCLISSRAIVKYSEKHEHEHLRETVEAMVPSLDIKLVRLLTGSPDDLKKDYYHSIKTTLLSLRRVNPSYRFVYLMGRKNGEVVFLADAEEKSSEDFSPPGQVYPGASEKVHRIFQDKQSFVEGPITDDWGTWVSAHAAIIDKENGNVLAILGLDIDASIWGETTHTYSLLSNIIVFLVILITSFFTIATLKIARDRRRIIDINSDLKTTREELLKKERLAVLGQLNAVVSHELRNPLGTISNASFLIKEAVKTSDTVKCEKALQLLERNIVRCNTIVDELLAFSKANNSLHEVLEIDPWIDKLITKDLLPENIYLQKYLKADVSIKADPERLRRAIDNVWQNAVHALSEKAQDTPNLQIQTRVKEHRLEVVIKDNGPGIPAEIKDKIMEPMFSTKNFGVGLGLPIVQNIMSDHGGGVSVESVVSQGTTVTLWLPVPND